MEASALQAPAGLARHRVLLGGPLLRLRSDEQLVALFRAGDEEAFRAIHDRYRTRLFAYTRQMLPGSRQDAEDALQDVFVKAYSGLRAHDRELALRAWLYRVAHNRCIDQLRRPAAVASDSLEPTASAATDDPIAAAEQREALRRLIADVRRLPDQQRSALLMRELSGMSYAELAAAMSLSVPAVKSLLVRARLGLAAAAEARDTACSAIREELAACHDRGVRPSPTARRHLHDCVPCREFRASVRSVSRNFAAFTPVLGPLGLIAKLTGIGLGGSAAASSGGGAAGGGAAGGGLMAVGGGAVAAGGAIGAGSALATGFMTTTAGHVAALLAAAVVTAGGAVEIQPATDNPAHHRAAGARSHTLRATPPTPSPASNSGRPAITALTPAPAAPAIVAAGVDQAVKPAVSRSAKPQSSVRVSGAFAASSDTAGGALPVPGTGAGTSAPGVASQLGSATGPSGGTDGGTVAPATGGGAASAGGSSTAGSSTTSGSSGSGTAGSDTAGSGSTSGSTSTTDGSGSASGSPSTSGSSSSGSGSTTGTSSGSSTGTSGSTGSSTGSVGSASTV